MKNYLSYKGYLGTVEYSSDDDLLFGKIHGIRDLVLYHGISLEDIKSDFRQAVDHYLDTCDAEGVIPNTPNSSLHMPA